MITEIFLSKIHLVFLLPFSSLNARGSSSPDSYRDGRAP
jgi:hypothetical protein